MLEADFEHSRPMRLSELEGSGFWNRFLVRAARLTAPVQ
jgi:hypothetical protein